MRLVYYGTPSFAVAPLRRLAADGRAPLLVVTRRDRPRGRGLELQPSPVRAAAEALGLPVATPARASAPEEVERVRALAPDLLIVVAYGQILSPELLALPRLGALNVHFSLLPRHRGAAPVQAALLAGDDETGVSTMWMTEGLDEGDVFLSRPTPIAPGENAGALGERLTEMGADLLAESLSLLDRGLGTRRPQDHALATYAPKIRGEDARLLFEAPAAELARRVRAYTPAPGAWIDLEAGRLVVVAANADEGEGAAAAAATAPRGLDLLPTPPGSVAGIDRARGLGVACGKGTLWLARVRPAGRKEMSGADYANGARLRPGSPLPLRARAASS
ncbi:MAG TPA: methionyl-tRNA formyltransferase [Candidatus Eisenbacteria bacterium]|nr:methionyl-tRNA formyltransferase [Candidatus Eisenbacteria bacterium]